MVSSIHRKFRLDDVELKFVVNFKYLGHIICNTMCDDDDIKREIRSLYVRTNILTRKYNKCSTHVKLILFKLFCMCFYDVDLWKKYFAVVFKNFKSCYHRCIKLFFKLFRKYDSVTNILLSLGLPTFNTIVCNAKSVLEIF
jgi:hypothetical protein